MLDLTSMFGGVGTGGFNNTAGAGAGAGTGGDDLDGEAAVSGEAGLLSAALAPQLRLHLGRGGVVRGVAVFKKGDVPEGWSIAGSRDFGSIIGNDATATATATANHSAGFGGGEAPAEPLLLAFRRGGEDVPVTDVDVIVPSLSCDAAAAADMEEEDAEEADVIAEALQRHAFDAIVDAADEADAADAAADPQPGGLVPGDGAARPAGATAASASSAGGTVGQLTAPAAAWRILRGSTWNVTSLSTSSPLTMASLTFPAGPVVAGKPVRGFTVFLSLATADALSSVTRSAWAHKAVKLRNRFASAGDADRIQQLQSPACGPPSKAANKLATGVGLCVRIDDGHGSGAPDVGASADRSADGLVTWALIALLSAEKSLVSLHWQVARALGALPPVHTSSSGGGAAASAAAAGGGGLVDVFQPTASAAEGASLVALIRAPREGSAAFRVDVDEERRAMAAERSGIEVEPLRAVSSKLDGFVSLPAPPGVILSNEAVRDAAASPASGASSAGQVASLGGGDSSAGDDEDEGIWTLVAGPDGRPAEVLLAVGRAVPSDGSPPAPSPDRPFVSPCGTDEAMDAAAAASDAGARNWRGPRALAVESADKPWHDEHAAHSDAKRSYVCVERGFIAMRRAGFTYDKQSSADNLVSALGLCRSEAQRALQVCSANADLAFVEQQKADWLSCGAFPDCSPDDQGIVMGVVEATDALLTASGLGAHAVSPQQPAGGAAAAAAGNGRLLLDPPKTSGAVVDPDDVALAAETAVSTALQPTSSLLSLVAREVDAEQSPPEADASLAAVVGEEAFRPVVDVMLIPEGSDMPSGFVAAEGCTLLSSDGRGTRLRLASPGTGAGAGDDEAVAADADPVGGTAALSDDDEPVMAPGARRRATATATATASQTATATASAAASAASAQSHRVLGGVAGTPNVIGSFRISTASRSDMVADREASRQPRNPVARSTKAEALLGSEVVAEVAAALVELAGDGGSAFLDPRLAEDALRGGSAGQSYMLPVPGVAMWSRLAVSRIQSSSFSGVGLTSSEAAGALRSDMAVPESSAVPPTVRRCHSVTAITSAPHQTTVVATLTSHRRAQLGLAVSHGAWYERGRALSQPEAPDCGLDSLLRLFHAPSAIESFQCEACGRSPALRSSLVDRFPAHLLVAASRFAMEWTSAGGRSTKIQHHLPFPARLCYPRQVSSSRSCAASAAAAASPGSAEIGAETGAELGAEYGLYAVVVHSGSGLQSGHYFTYARPSDDPHLDLEDSPTGAWRRFDDASVDVVSWSAMTTSLRQSSFASAFMLLYRRLDWAPGKGETAAASSDATLQQSNDDLVRSLAQRVGGHSALRRADSGSSTGAVTGSGSM
ncbi:hypothetical protein FNF29_06563 [Cafeteria roenbergensis]|uniref:USP domain-containing protein n=1 Tax=Cafeteria roenbergensis TaxID=33653 RepID=A0A5A8C6G3_CAFRO|nr:hypothetical protein FNF29_06563 [Cafeteria roenbergensis]|eukprot:KAA0148626.1 hypothetical protein FNF29_06563 [Cafeteria roenbergensis]